MSPILYKKFSMITTIILIFIILLAGLFSIPKFLGYDERVVLSGSMEPTIPTGSLVFVNLKKRDPKVGDVISYRRSDNDEITVTHRIVGTAGDGFITKGDANAENDFVTVYPDRIDGTVKAHIPWIGFVINGIGAEHFFTLIIWITVIDFLLMMTLEVFKPEKRKSQ